MKILVVTNSCSDKKYKEICGLRNKKMIDPQQKFFRLFIDGLGKIATNDIEVVSAVPVSASTIDKYIFKYEQETTDNGVVYYHLPFFNGKCSRYISLMLAAYKYVKKWCKTYKNEDCCIIVDPLIPVLAIPSKKIAQKYNSKIVAVVTDIPTLATEMKERREGWFKAKCLAMYQRVADNDLETYDAYITLTKSINDKVNVKKRPYCIVEGFADAEDTRISVKHENYIMYAGGIYEKYGVKKLVEAFRLMQKKDIELYIFGEGSYVSELLEVCQKDSRIKYKGCVSPDEVVEYEKKALLLVNPRPTDEEFAKYSFPSKTMEYLLSGTATVSTKLPGIPEEYFNYMFSFDGDSTTEIKNKLEEILSLPKDELIKKGKIGHDFVMNKKNNIVMAKKVYDFINITN